MICVNLSDITQVKQKKMPIGGAQIGGVVDRILHDFHCSWAKERSFHPKKWVRGECPWGVSKIHPFRVRTYNMKQPMCKFLKKKTWVFPKIWENPPNHPFVHRVLEPLFSPSILGVKSPYFWFNTHIPLFQCDEPRCRSIMD